LVCGDRGELNPGPLAQHRQRTEVIDVTPEICIEMQFHKSRDQIPQKATKDTERILTEGNEGNEGKPSSGLLKR
jgi:hypothetical protein